MSEAEMIGGNIVNRTNDVRKGADALRVIAIDPFRGSTLETPNDVGKSLTGRTVIPPSNNPKPGV